MYFVKGKMTLFKNKCRVESTRLKDWDYSNNAAYFVTMCAKHMRCYFGKVVDGKIKLSRIGKIVEEEWLRTDKMRDNIVLDEYAIMPNHIHGILMIMNDPEASPLSSLPNIIKGFKSACSSRILNLCNENFKWQP
jgi:putative transposase